MEPIVALFFGIASIFGGGLTADGRHLHCMKFAWRIER
jgi:hypothetical protein